LHLATTGHGLEYRTVSNAGGDGPPANRNFDPGGHRHRPNPTVLTGNPVGQILPPFRGASAWLISCFFFRVNGTRGQATKFAILFQSESQVSDSDKMYRRIIEAVPGGIRVVDPQGRTIFSNRRIAEIQGRISTQWSNSHASRASSRMSWQMHSVILCAPGSGQSVFGARLSHFTTNSSSPFGSY
jgi:hypothetical protein